MSANAAECPPANAPVSVRRRKMQNAEKQSKNDYTCRDEPFFQFVNISFIALAVRVEP